MKQIFIDESGTHKKDGKSSIALVYVSVSDAGSLDKAVVAIERDLGIRSFHWSHSTWAVRRKFVENVSRQAFALKIALVKNPFRESFSYEHILSELISEKEISSITIDGKKSKKYERYIKRALGSRGLSIRKLRTANDKSYPALRIADACAGIARYYEEHPDDKRIISLYEFISKKIIVLIEE